MDVELLLPGTDYIYINHLKEQIKVRYLNMESDGLTFYKFRSVEDGVTYSLFEYEVEEFITKT